MIRILKGLTQFDLQKKSGVSHSTLSMIERGHREPTSKQKKTLTRVLGVPEQSIFGEDE
jgi:transcriptional regulator with XRE-family HTH domain